MDIQALLAARTRWQPASAVSGSTATSKTAGTETGSIGTGGEIGFHGAATGKTMVVGGLTATNHSLVESATDAQEEPPSAADVEAARKQIGHQLQMALGIAGIQPSPPLRFALNVAGEPELAGDDPRAAQVQQVLDGDPALRDQLKQLLADARQVEQAAAQAGWLRQVNGGMSQKEADRNLKNAMDQIGKANGFTLDGDDLTLDVTGMGDRLMAADAAPPSDDERMWRETLRLTDRMAPTGVTGAAAMARAEDQAAKDGPDRVGLRLGGPKPDLKDGSSAAETVKAA